MAGITCSYTCFSAPIVFAVQQLCLFKNSLLAKCFSRIAPLVSVSLCLAAASSTVAIVKFTNQLTIYPKACELAKNRFILMPILLKPMS